MIDSAEELKRETEYTPMPDLGELKRLMLETTAQGPSPADLTRWMGAPTLRNDHESAHPPIHSQWL